MCYVFGVRSREFIITVLFWTSFVHTASPTCTVRRTPSPGFSPWYLASSLPRNVANFRGRRGRQALCRRSTPSRGFTAGRHCLPAHWIVKGQPRGRPFRRSNSHFRSRSVRGRNSLAFGRTPLLSFLRKFCSLRLRHGRWRRQNVLRSLMFYLSPLSGFVITEGHRTKRACISLSPPR